MGSNPINLAFRFILEIAALIAIGSWGWGQSDGALRYVLAIGLPLVAATLWGTFAVLDDPSRSGKAPVPVPGVVRLLLELAFFGAAAFGLYASDRVALSLIMAGAVIVHYALSYDRIGWLLKQ